jgi:hypothetical protein
MREVALTLQHVGVEPMMALATARRQEHLVGQMAKRRLGFDSTGFSWRSLSDALVRTRRRSGSGK